MSPRLMHIAGCAGLGALVWYMCAVLVVITSRMDNHDLLVNTSSGFLNIPRCSSYCTVTFIFLQLL